MKIALIGYGKMGHAVADEATKHGHTVVCTIDNEAEWAERDDILIHADVAIEFSQPTMAAANIERCITRGVPIVCGTTGWYGEYDRLAKLCREHNGRMLTATNFSIGMNIMFALNRKLAELMRGRGYSVDITETHHIHKLDAPSGTAITLREQIVENGDKTENDVPIESIREGEIAGIHTVRYDSPADTITITHEAHSRLGLAQGALLAAEWLSTAAPGVYTMNDVI